MKVDGIQEDQCFFFFFFWKSRNDDGDRLLKSTDKISRRVFTTKKTYKEEIRGNVSHVLIKINDCVRCVRWRIRKNKFKELKYLELFDKRFVILTFFS